MLTRKCPKAEYNKDEVETDLIFVGLAAMRDPPRMEVKDAVLKAKQAGVKTVIITGDYGPTARLLLKKLELSTGNAAKLFVV